MKQFTKWISLSAGLALLAVWSATGQGQKASGPSSGYLEPRYPDYLVKPVTSVEELMPNARALVRNRVGIMGLGLGALKSGETVLIVTTVSSDDIVVEAVRRALQERSVKVEIVPDYKLVNVSREDALSVGRRQYAGAQDGYQEAALFWINGGWRDPDRQAAKDWLKSQRPDLYEKLYPQKKDLPANLEAIRRKLWGSR